MESAGVVLLGLIQVADGVYVLTGRTNVGVLAVNESECIVVDTGIDQDSGRRILNNVKRLNLNVRAVINTHSHADHIGGNKIIFERSGAGVYASALEKPFIELPTLEILYLYGAYPPVALRSHLVEAAGVPVKDIGDLVGDVRFLEVKHLPGHSLGMIGIGVNGVFFSADAFFSAEILMKHRVPYHLSAQEAYKTLEKLAKEVRDYNAVVPSHGEVLTGSDSAEVISKNIEAITSVKEAVIRNVRTGGTVDGLIKNVLQDLSVNIQNPVSYFLMRSALMSYVAWLLNEGFIELSVSNNELVITERTNSG